MSAAAEHPALASEPLVPLDAEAHFHERIKTMVLCSDPGSWYQVDIGSRVRRADGRDDAVRVASESHCSGRITVRYHDPKTDPPVTSWSVRSGRRGEQLLHIEQKATLPNQLSVWHGNFHIDFAMKRDGRIIFAALLADAVLYVVSCNQEEGSHGLDAATLDSQLNRLRRPANSLPNPYQVQWELAEQARQLDCSLETILADVQKQTRRARIQFDRFKRQLHALRYKEELLQTMVESKEW